MNSKKYYFILKGYPRLSETFIAQEIHLLETLGYDISIISMRQPREAERQPINEKIKADVTYLPEYINQDLLSVIKYNFYCLVRYPLTYIKYFFISIFKSIYKCKRDSIKRFLQSAWIIGKINLKNENTHIHSHFIHSPTSIARNIKKLTGIKYSISAHAKDIYTIPKKEVIQKIENSEFLTTCTRFNLDFMKTILSPEAQKKISLSYHGIDTHFFTPAQGHCLREEDPYLLSSVGRLVDKKGYDIILEALAEVKSCGITFSYDIYGEGDLRKEVEAAIERFDLKDEVHLHGSTTHREIIQRFTQKGIFLCGSRISDNGDRDGIPNTIAEAMSMELPVIATKVSGIPELIKHKESGWLIPERDSKAMAEAITYLIKHPEETDKISKQGRERVIDFFNATKCISRVDQLFAKVQ